MELNKVELVVVQNVEQQAVDAQLRLLDEMQLALVGGGIADVIYG